jgi:hypothetical protein
MKFAASVFAVILCLAPLARARAEVIPDFSSETWQLESYLVGD